MGVRMKKYNEMGRRSMASTVSGHACTDQRTTGMLVAEDAWTAAIDRVIYRADVAAQAKVNTIMVDGRHEGQIGNRQYCVSR